MQSLSGSRIMFGAPFLQSLMLFIQMALFVFTLVSSIILPTATNGEVYSAVITNVGTVQIVYSTKSGCAHASFNNSVNATGWATLTVVGNASCSYKDAAQAMGYLEGYLTQELIWDAFVNFNVSNKYLQGGYLPRILQNYTDTQRLWMESQISQHSASSRYWRHVHALLLQSDGLCQGYHDAAPQSQQLSSKQVSILALSADLEDLSAAIPYINKSSSACLMQTEYLDVVQHDDFFMDCSALVKLDIANMDLFSGHTTFNAYWAALRIFKHYTYPWAGTDNKGITISFSSRPGDLHSKDDFYLLSSRMTVIETSLTVFNRTLYCSLTPESTPAWIRAQTANSLASSSPHWVNLFLKHNSGTHNNEWIITDYNLFHKGKPLQKNTVWMVDQMVHYVESADATDRLSNNLYVPSYNIPSFPSIFKVSGYGMAGFNYTTDPRAMIFHRDHVKVHDLGSMCMLMNSNDYKNDPLSKGDPCNQISARCDLRQNNNTAYLNEMPPMHQLNGPLAFGGIDSKNVNQAYVDTQRIQTISGMPYTHVPPFSFTGEWDTVSHQGLPTSFKFNWTIMSPAHHLFNLDNSAIAMW